MLLVLESRFQFTGSSSRYSQDHLFIIVDPEPIKPLAACRLVTLDKMSRFQADWNRRGLQTDIEQGRPRSHQC